MISAYGPQAQSYAAGLPAMSAIVIDANNVLEGLLEAIRRRALGETFYALLILDPIGDRTMTALGSTLLNDDRDPDRKRAILNRFSSGDVILGGKSGPEYLSVPDIEDPLLRKTVMEFFALSSAMLVRSHQEYGRLLSVVRHALPYEVVLVEPPLPVAERRPAKRSGVILWAPERNAATVGLYAFALAEVHADLTIVSADGVSPPGMNATALQPADPRLADALATAACVVLSDAGDPGAAVAFARRGLGVVAPLSSGAGEFVRNVQGFDPVTPRQIYAAVARALGQPASVRALPPAPPPAPVKPRLPISVSEVPPATIVIPTFNRRADLARALECVGAQTYPNVRAIVANDAGERVDDIVARFPFARLLHLDRNGGTTRAFMAGAKLVDDGFVQVLSDDDWLYPDHIERLAIAMLRSGEPLAHSNTLIRYVVRGDDGFLTRGFNASIFFDTVTPGEALICTAVAGHSVLFRRSLFEEIGGWREDSALSDQEFQLRALQRYSFAYVDHFTCEWRIHTENFSSKTDAVGEQRRIFELLHATPDRPYITEQRAAMLANIAARPKGEVFPPTTSLAPPQRLS